MDPPLVEEEMVPLFLSKIIIVVIVIIVVIIIIKYFKNLKVSFYKSTTCVGTHDFVL